MTFRHALTQMLEVDPQMWETRFHPNLALCNLEGTKKKTGKVTAIGLKLQEFKSE